MNREELKALGLTDDQIDKVMASHGKVVNSIKEKADQVDTLESQIEDYKKQLEDRDEQLNELSEKAKGNEELTAQIDELKQQNETTKTEYEQKLQQQAFDYTLEKTLTGAKVRNPKALKALLDLETIKMDGDKLLGLDDQLKTIQESDPYLFEQKQQEEPPKPSFTTGQHQTNGGSDDPFAAKLAKYN